MGINVQTERNDRSVVGVPLLDIDGKVARALAKAWTDDQKLYPIASSIDPYGDTLLNYLLTSLLLADIAQLKSEHPEDEAILESISDFGEYVVQRPAERLFLAFIGD